MKVKEMLELLRFPKSIEFRDSENFEICITKSDSSGVIPYMEKEIEKWFPLSKPTIPYKDVDICILLKDEQEESNDNT